MNDLFIFGFGLAVTVLVGSATTMLIVQKNRVLDREEDERARRDLPTAAERRAD